MPCINAAKNSATTFVIALASAGAFASPEAAPSLDRAVLAHQCVEYVTHPSRTNVLPILADPVLARRACSCAADAVLGMDPAVREAHERRIGATYAAHLLRCTADALDEPLPPEGNAASEAGRLGAALGRSAPPVAFPSHEVDRLSCPDLVYPPAARRNGVEGQTFLAFRIDRHGWATSVDVIQSSGDSRLHKMLDTTAGLTYMNCLFRPTSRVFAGQEGWAVLRVNWRLSP